jgi:hypothetical protein
MKALRELWKRLSGDRHRDRDGGRRPRTAAYQPIDSHHWGNRMEIHRHLVASRSR